MKKLLLLLGAAVSFNAFAAEAKSVVWQLAIHNNTDNTILITDKNASGQQYWGDSTLSTQTWNNDHTASYSGTAIPPKKTMLVFSAAYLQEMKRAYGSTAWYSFNIYNEPDNGAMLFSDPYNTNNLIASLSENINIYDDHGFYKYDTFLINDSQRNGFSPLDSDFWGKCTALGNYCSDYGDHANISNRDEVTADIYINGISSNEVIVNNVQW